SDRRVVSPYLDRTVTAAFEIGDRVVDARVGVAASIKEDAGHAGASNVGHQRCSACSDKIADRAEVAPGRGASAARGSRAQVHVERAGGGARNRRLRNQERDDASARILSGGYP